tara:strand:- start:615 stop:1283 length:669 start_codon:yes stop_codon:yes gene_type:complete
MSTAITSVQENNISHAMFLDVQIGANVYYMSSAYKPITIGSNTYNELGSFLNIDNFTDDIRQTEGDVTLSLSGIPSENDYMAQILAEPIKGGNVTVQRAFFSLATNEIIPGQVFTRYKGIITNFSVQDDANRVANQETMTVSIMTSSINSVLKNQIAGQRTNPDERKRLFPGDKIFDNIPNLFNTSFDFGKEYSGGGGYGGGTGGGGGGGGGRRQKIIEEQR